jgi:hypothetical protein
MARHDDDFIWKVMSGIGGFLFVMLVATVFRGYVLSEMWSWFIVPLGAPALTVVHAIGISMLVAFLTYQHDATKKAERDDGSVGEKLFTMLFASCFYTAWVWGMGAIAHSFM